MRRRGFTLVELLVVIAIIALVASMMLPVFARVRASGRSVVCVSNLKQLGHAFSMYCSDYDGALPDEFRPGWSPPYDYWGGWEGYRIALQPYLNNLQIFICPEQGTSTYVSYGLPQWNVIASAVWGVIREQDIPSPSDAILLAENWSTWYSTRDTAHSDAFPPDGNVAWERHAGGANYLFCDGHVKWLTRMQTYDPVCMWWPFPHAPVRCCRGRDH